MSRLVVQLLGGFAVRDMAGVQMRIASRKGRALLAFLAARPGESHTRDRLAALLWEEADDELARTSLRQALTAIRKALPEAAHPVLIADADTVSLDAARLDTDLAAVRECLATGTRTALQQALAQHRGELLEGLDARSTAFEEWLNQERLALRREFVEGLQRLSSLCAAQEDVDGALAASARLVMLEPLNESAHRTLMELHARRNAFAEALRQYQLCRDILRRELDISPEPATEQLYRDLMRRRRTAAAGPVSHDETPESEPIAASATSERRTELRDAVVLAVRLEGLLELELKLEPEEAHALGRNFQQRVRATVEPLQGLSDRRTGSSVLVVFGATEVRGNEAELAVRAALDLQRSIREGDWTLPPGLRLRVGIAQGQILRSAELFPLSGRPAHLAHALATHPQNEGICIAPAVRNSLGSGIDVTALPAPAGTDADCAWQLHSLQQDARTSAVPLVGRRPELAMIVAVLDRCRSSRHGRAIVIRGEAGIGKSRLVHALTAAARESAIAVHVSSVFDFGQSPTRRPVTTLALSLLGLRPDAPAEERSAAVVRAICSQGGGVDQRIFLSDLVDAPLDDELAAIEKAMDTATRQRGRALALAQLIETAAQRSPLLLVVEDVHWTDQDELARFGEIAAVIAQCPGLFVMTTRPEGDPIGALWRARARGCPVTTVDLAPLADDEAQELASHYPNLSRDVVAACITRAEGNPLFLDQLLRAAFDGQDCLPGSVRTLVLARAERLGSTDRDALQAAAVLGQRLSLDALRSLLEDPEYTPQALVEAGLVRPDGPEFEFSHALFRDAIYESTLRSRRREMHRLASAWFARSDLALRADHLAAAEDAEACAAYLEAARAEQGASRFERALMLANRANAAARDPLQLHRTQCLLGELLLVMGRTHDALTAYRESIDFAPHQQGQVEAWIGVAATLRVMDRLDEALDALDRAERALGDGGDAPIRVRIFTLRGNLCFPLGRFEDCLRAHEEAMRLATAAHLPLELTRAFGGLGDAWYQRGRLRTARDYFARAVEESRRHNLPGVRLANMPMLALTQLYCGNTAAAEEDLRQGLELSRQISDPRSELVMELVKATTLLIRGEFERCDLHARRSVDLARQLGARRFQAEALSQMAGVLLVHGERSQAETLVREALELGRSSSMHYCGPALLGLLARATQSAQERRAALREAEALLADGCVSHSYFEFYYHAIEISLAGKQWDDAVRYAEALAAYTQDEPLPWTEVLIRRARCLAALGSGKSDDSTVGTLRDLRDTCRKLTFGLPLRAIEEALRSSDGVTE